MEKRQTYNIYTTCYGGNAGANARNNLCTGEGRSTLSTVES